MSKCSVLTLTSSQ